MLWVGVPSGYYLLRKCPSASNAVFDASINLVCLLCVCMSCSLRSGYEFLLCDAPVLTWCLYRWANGEKQLPHATSATMCDAAVGCPSSRARSLRPGPSKLAALAFAWLIAFVLLPVGAPHAGGDCFGECWSNWRRCCPLYLRCQSPSRGGLPE